MHRTFIALLVTIILATPVSAVTLTFDNGGGNGSVQPLPPAAPFNTRFILNGSTSNQTTTQTYSAISSLPQQVKGRFLYLPRENRPGLESFGIIFGPGFTRELGNSAGPARQQGVFNFAGFAGQPFGWYTTSSPGSGPAARVAVNANIAPVPLPATMGILMAGVAALLGIGGRRRRTV